MPETDEKIKLVVGNFVCRRCKRGQRIAASYEYGGVTHDDGYCGWCGLNWPLVKSFAEEK